MSDMIYKNFHQKITNW